MTVMRHQPGTPYAEAISDRIAANVRAELARSQTSADDLAEAIGVAPSNARKRLAGHVQFTAVEIVLAAGLMRVPVGALLEHDRPAEAVPRHRGPGVLGG